MGRLFNPIATSSTPTLTPPSYLTQAQVNEWNQLIQILTNNRTLNEADVDIIAQYAILKTHFLICKEMVEREGMVSHSSKNGPKRHPASVAMSDLFKQMNTIAAQLGLSPTARARILTESAPSGEDTISSILDLKQSLLGKYEQRT